MSVERFAFAFDRRFVPLLAAIGARPSNSDVVIDDQTFDARFGPWRVTTPTANLADARITRDYHWYKAIGVRGSSVDGGATFGSNRRAGVCVCFHEPVRCLPGMRHPALTVTVEDPEALADAVKRRLRAG